MPNQTIRVGLLADYVEEGWPSMDFVADMLFQHLSTVQGLDVTLLRPRMPQLWSSFSGGSRTPDRLWGRFVHYPSWVRRRRQDFDIFHVVDHSYAQLLHVLPADRTVVTCHDLDTFSSILYPGENARSFPFRCMSSVIWNGLRRAAHVFAVSESTAEALRKTGAFPAHGISTTPNGVSDEFRATPEHDADKRFDELLGPVTGPVILSVSSTIPRKRIDLLLQIFSGIRSTYPEAILARVGGALNAEQQALAEELDLPSSIRTLPFLTRSQLAAAYRRADLCLVTSEAEGFGLPVVEALACGCPVLSSDLPVLREVGGKRVCYRPVGAIPEWVTSSVALLATRPEREALSDSVAHLKWPTTARLIAERYRAVLRA